NPRPRPAGIERCPFSWVTLRNDDDQPPQARFSAHRRCDLDHTDMERTADPDPNQAFDRRLALLGCRTLQDTGGAVERAVEEAGPTEDSDVERLSPEDGQLAFDQPTRSKMVAGQHVLARRRSVKCCGRAEERDDGARSDSKPERASMHRRADAALNAVPRFE